MKGKYHKKHERPYAAEEIMSETKDSSTASNENETQLKSKATSNLIFITIKGLSGKLRKKLSSLKWKWPSATTIGIVIAAAAGFIYFLQLRAMQGQLGAMNKQLDVMKRDQRPWIKFNFYPQDIKNGSADMGEIHVSNAGKNPAFNLTGGMCLEILYRTQEPSLDCPSQVTPFDTGIMFPNAGNSDVPKIPIVNFTKPPFVNVKAVGSQPIPFDKTTEDAYANGETYVVVYANIKYYDSFDPQTLHWTHACYAIQRQGTFVNGEKCVKFNDADKN